MTFRAFDGMGVGLARHCARCGVIQGKGPDSCLGTLPDVRHACCGHGSDEPYVVIGGDADESCAFDKDGIDYLTLCGDSARWWFALEGRHVR